MPNINIQNELNIDVFKLQKQKLYLFQQYKKHEWIQKFFNLIDKIIQERYYNALKDMWSERDILRSSSLYLIFYARYYLGIIRPININSSDESTEDPSDTTLHIYDANVRYDTRWIYDDYYQANPGISAALFNSFLRFILDYSQETWTHDYIIKLAAEWCKQDPTDVKIIFKPDKVQYSLIATTDAREFVASHKNDAYDMNMPFFDCYEFILGDHTKKADSLNDLMLGYETPEDWPQSAKFRQNKTKKG
ncbi:TPA: hypothetical protein R1765_001968 [Campylobacter coli]|nr:hypothetical protein [Campylobacter coli]